MKHAPESRRPIVGKSGTPVNANLPASVAADSVPVQKPRTYRSREQIAEIKRAAYAIARKDAPVSCRYIYYRLLDLHAQFEVPIEKSNAGAAVVGRYLREMRLDGDLPYHWITDDSRAVFDINAVDDADEWADLYADTFRTDPWRFSPYLVEIWVESRSIAGMIRHVCDRLSVPLYVCAGQPSMTYCYNAAQAINDKVGDRKVVIVYIGDRDKAGGEIEDQVGEKLRRHLDRGIDLALTRLAVTLDQIQRFNLPTKPGKGLHGTTTTTEAEALPADTLRQLLRDETHKYIDPQTLMDNEREDRATRDTIRLLPFGHIVNQYRRPA